MKKKSIRALAAMLAAAAVLSGCGDGTGGTESTGSCFCKVQKTRQKHSRKLRQQRG